MTKRRAITQPSFIAASASDGLEGDVKQRSNKDLLTQYKEERDAHLRLLVKEQQHAAELIDSLKLAHEILKYYANGGGLPIFAREILYQQGIWLRPDVVARDAEAQLEASDESQRAIDEFLTTDRGHKGVDGVLKDSEL